jgi:hypothetical protein
MISIKHIIWVIGGAITLWLAVGCSAPYRALDSASSPQPADQEAPKKIII